MPFIAASGELKTKPTQHSVRELMEIGIQPDILVCRADRPLSDEIKRKIALFCNVEHNCVIESSDARSIYEVPLRFQEQETKIRTNPPPQPVAMSAPTIPRFSGISMTVSPLFFSRVWRAIAA